MRLLIRTLIVAHSSMDFKFTIIIGNNAIYGFGGEGGIRTPVTLLG
jgi:hypothetical protein